MVDIKEMDELTHLIELMEEDYSIVAESLIDEMKYLWKCLLSWQNVAFPNMGSLEEKVEFCLDNPTEDLECVQQVLHDLKHVEYFTDTLIPDILSEIDLCSHSLLYITHYPEVFENIPPCMTNKLRV
mgnify:FL=1